MGDEYLDGIMKKVRKPAKIERLMALCDAADAGNSVYSLKPSELRAILTLMQGLVMIAEQSQDEGAQDVLADFDRWNKESEDGNDY